ncbi:CAP-Gly domain-containing protein [Endozoicomonas sp. Mp262]|uniref:CAP-Gly domain-containing protein n=1 Tax=Endozoicomonas sp. Mp262 TaxID=2919499 RepID=UPI0021D96125
MILFSFLEKIVFLTLPLVFFSKIYAEIEIDPAQCQTLYPHIAFQGVKKFKLPRYMEDIHAAYDCSALEIPEHLRAYHKQKKHPDCDTFDCFLGFVFLCIKEDTLLNSDEIFSESELDKMVRDIVLYGSHKGIVYWYNMHDPHILPGAKVVWHSDHGEENGTIKWLGMLEPNKSLEITIGVEFDNRVGSGTGKYNEQRLFHAKQGHASLMPPLGLIGKGTQFESINKENAQRSIDSALPSLPPDVKKHFAGKTVSDVQQQKFKETGRMDEVETDGFYSFLTSYGKPNKYAAIMHSYTPSPKSSPDQHVRQAQSMPLTNETDKEKVISQVKNCIKRKGYNFSDQDIRTKFSHINKYNPMATNTEENIERIAKVIILILKDKNVYEAK